MQRRHVVIERELEFIVRDSGLDESVVCAVLDADRDYMRKRGIVR
jgi:hypothetical protein